MGQRDNNQFLKVKAIDFRFLVPEKASTESSRIEMLKKQKEKNRNHHQLQYNRERKNTITKIIKGPPPQVSPRDDPCEPLKVPLPFLYKSLQF